MRQSLPERSYRETFVCKDGYTMTKKTGGEGEGGMIYIPALFALQLHPTFLFGSFIFLNPGYSSDLGPSIPEVDSLRSTTGCIAHLHIPQIYPTLIDGVVLNIFSKFHLIVELQLLHKARIGLNERPNSLYNTKGKMWCKAA